MTEKPQKARIITPDPWSNLKTFTEARIGLGRCGTSLPLSESLQFKLAHARARDAVHKPADLVSLAHEFTSSGLKILQLKSSVSDRVEYLTRPDKGRTLDKKSEALLAEQARGFDLSIIICDGLSATAVDENAAKVVLSFLQILSETALTCAPICLVTNGRVAIGDHIGGSLQAKMTIMLIGERPGLSSPNSLGAYLSYNPHPGTTDEARNCISNIRTGGLSTEEAVKKIAYLTEKGLQFQKTGVGLKDTMSHDYLPLGNLKIT